MQKENICSKSVQEINKQKAFHFERPFKCKLISKNLLIIRLHLNFYKRINIIELKVKESQSQGA
jgi:hypothetical protein